MNPGMTSFNPYAAGQKIYGGGRYNPTSGPVDPTGYKERDRRLQVRRNALGAKLKAMQNKNYGSPDFGRYS